jgi:hypothetical protein
MALLILHAPAFWKWVIAPLVIFILEKIYRGISTYSGHGKSYIEEAAVLPSRYLLIFTREYTKCTAGSTFCFVVVVVVVLVLGKPLIKLASISADS